jgi:hypothetical protein
MPEEATMTRLTRSSLVALTALALVATGFATLQAQSRGRHSELMRRKLTYAQRILEGVALEDYATIAKGARELKELSEDAEWNAFPDMDYLRYSNEFRTICDDLSVQSKEKNLDGATLSYMRLTMNCVNCHKFVRVIMKK